MATPQAGVWLVGVGTGLPTARLVAGLLTGPGAMEVWGVRWPDTHLCPETLHLRAG